MTSHDFNAGCAERGGGCSDTPVPAADDAHAKRQRSLALYRAIPEGARGLAKFNSEARAIADYELGTHFDADGRSSLAALKEVAAERGYHWDEAAGRFFGDPPLAFGVDSPARRRRGRRR